MRRLLPWLLVGLVHQRCDRRCRRDRRARRHPGAHAGAMVADAVTATKAAGTSTCTTPRSPPAPTPTSRLGHGFGRDRLLRAHDARHRGGRPAGVGRRRGRRDPPDPYDGPRGVHPDRHDAPSELRCRRWGSGPSGRSNPCHPTRTTWAWRRPAAARPCSCSPAPVTVLQRPRPRACLRRGRVHDVLPGALRTPVGLPAARRPAGAANREHHHVARCAPAPGAGPPRRVRQREDPGRAAKGVSRVGGGALRLLALAARKPRSRLAVVPRYPATALRRGSTQPGRGKWQVYPFG